MNNYLFLCHPEFSSGSQIFCVNHYINEIPARGPE